MGKNNKLIDVWIFTALLFIVPAALSFSSSAEGGIPISAIPIIVGILGFLFWKAVNKKPALAIFSPIYPYKKLKLWAALSAFVFFQYILVWGLHSEQIKLEYAHFYSIIAVFVGCIAFYFSFVRMKVSLRYLCLAIFIPLLAMGLAIGIGRYFGFIEFFSPKENIIGLIFLNTIYWILFNILYQLICEEPAFRGFLTQRLMGKGQVRAVIISSFIFAAWHVAINLFASTDFIKGTAGFIESFIVGCLLALLFIKGKNLLIPAIAHGIISGLKISLFAGDKHAGLGQYFKILSPVSEFNFISLWLICLSLGVVLVIITPEKIRPDNIFAKSYKRM